MRLAHRTRHAAVVLIPLLVAAVSTGVVSSLAGVSFFPPLRRGGFAPSAPPPVQTPAPHEAASIIPDLACGWGWPVVACAALVLVGLVVSIHSLHRRRTRPSRRVRLLPLRAGSLALLFGVAVSAILVASDITVMYELFQGDNYVSSDWASRFWGCLGGTAAGLTLALAGILVTCIVALASCRPGRRSSSASGDRS